MSTRFIISTDILPNLPFSKKDSYVITVHQYIHNSSTASGDENLDFILYIYFMQSVRKQVLNGEKDSETNNEEKLKNKERIKKRLVSSKTNRREF
jgi:hypothetical protein